MFYCKVNDFVSRKESVLLEDGTSFMSERIFINNRVRDFEKYNDRDEISSTIIIVKGLDTDYLSVMSPHTKCIGDVYKVSGYDEEMYVFEIFAGDSDFDNVSELLNMTRNGMQCHLQIYVHLHQYYDFNTDVVLPITSLSLSHDDFVSTRLLIGIAS